MEESAGTDNLFSSLLNRLGVSGQDNLDESSYHSYPASRPFINTDYRRSPSRPITSFPESNRDGVISALRNLQERMQNLEVERQDAENNLRSLASETNLYRSSLPERAQPADSFHTARPMYGESGTSVSNGVGNIRPKARELEAQLSSAETRCQLLEKQLDYMRKMVQTAEKDRVEAVQKADVLQQQQQQQEQQHAQHQPSLFTPDYQGQLERISELERDHLRLTATQTLAESKIKELETKLKDERDHRRKLQERALDLESAAVSHQLLLNSGKAAGKEPPDSKGRGKKPPATKKKKKLVSRKQIPPKSEPTKHYRLNLADIPFVAGKSTGPSHAVGANVQKVLALMKSHNLALCSSMYNGHCHGEGGGEGCASPALSSSSSSSISVDQDLTELLAQLQDEFGQLSCEHQDLLHQINAERNPRIREDIERELDIVLERMENKGQQISRVRQHQRKLEEKARRPTKPCIRKVEPVPRPNSAMGRLQATHRHPPPHSSDGSKQTHSPRPRSSSRCANDRKYKDHIPPSLDVLRDMRKLQSTLRQDDLCWE